MAAFHPFDGDGCRNFIFDRLLSCDDGILEISTIVFIFFSFEYFLSGQTFPVDIMPVWFRDILRFLPFPYELFFPVQVFMERVNGAALWTGFGIQACWVLVMFGVAQTMWRLGLRKYQAVGG